MNQVIDYSKECPICLSDETTTGKYCHGCDHEFCYSCISSWVLNHARCPLCNSEIYGFHSQDSSVYLTPHYNNFGMHIKKNGHYTEIDKILKNGIAKQYDLKTGSLIMINNKHLYSDCLEQINSSLKNKNMIKVDVATQIKEPTKEPNCFEFLFKRCRVLPWFT